MRNLKNGTLGLLKQKQNYYYKHCVFICSYVLAGPTTALVRLCKDILCFTNQQHPWIPKLPQLTTYTSFSVWNTPTANFLFFFIIISAVKSVSLHHWDNPRAE